SFVEMKRRPFSFSMKRRLLSVIPGSARYDRHMPEETAPETPPRAERRDRARNREKIIAAAQEVFAASGIHAPLDRIAVTAGVGAGTLYRHFPTRAALWSAVL